MEEFNQENEWKDKSNKTLKERKSFLRVLDTKVCFISLIFVVCIGIGLFYYFGTNDYFKPVLVDNSTCINTNNCPVIPACPNCVIPACPNPIVNVSIPTINVRCNSSG